MAISHREILAEKTKEGEAEKSEWKEKKKIGANNTNNDECEKKKKLTTNKLVMKVAEKKCHCTICSFADKLKEAKRIHKTKQLRSCKADKL